MLFLIWGFTFPSVVMTAVNFVVELNPLMVLKVGMLVQLFAIVHSLHRQKCSSQKHLPERSRVCCGSHGEIWRHDGGGDVQPDGVDAEAVLTGLHDLLTMR